MPLQRHQRWIIILAPVALRAALVPFIDDPDADGYSRVLITERLADAFRTGAFDWNMLYIPAWMPAWHLLCAAVELVIPAPYYVPKFLSALFGGLTPALVFLIAKRMGQTYRAGWIAWAIAAVLPLHVLYSATAMTEAFCGFWIVLAVLTFLRSRPDNHWMLSAAAAMLPVALTRYEVWFLLPLFPLLAIRQHRASWATTLLATALLALGPCLWFLLNFALTGNPLSFRAGPTNYLHQMFQFYPAAADRGLKGWLGHLFSVILGGSLTITVFGIQGFLRCRSREAKIVAAFVATHLTVMFTLWILHLQVGYPRHYMTDGLLLASLAAVRIDGTRYFPSRERQVLVLELIAIAFFAANMATWSVRLREAGQFLASRPGVIYCDEPGVLVLSGLPRSRFVRHMDDITFLRDHNVRWVVYSGVDYSPLPRLLPQLASGLDAPPFHHAYTPPTRNPPPHQVHVFELNEIK